MDNFALGTISISPRADSRNHRDSLVILFVDQSMEPLTIPYNRISKST